MIRIQLNFLLLCLCSIAGVSCSMASDNEYNEYFRTHVDTEHGEFYIGLEPRPSLVSQDGHQIEVWGSPFRLNIQYYPKGVRVLEGEITNLNVRSIETLEPVYSYTRKVDVYREEQLDSRNNQKRMLGFGFELIDIPYDDYEIILEYKIFSGKETLLESGQIRANIIRNYYIAKKRRGVGII